MTCAKFNVTLFLCHGWNVFNRFCLWRHRYNCLLTEIWYTIKKYIGMQFVLFIIYFWRLDTVRAFYDLCVTGDPMTLNDLCFSFKRKIWSFTFILITIISIQTVDYIRPSRFVIDVWIGMLRALAPFDLGSYICNTFFFFSERYQFCFPVIKFIVLYSFGMNCFQ